MTSSVFFKFKSQKEPTRVEFDGTGISVFELKRDIILKSGLGDGTDFDLAIYSFLWAIECSAKHNRGVTEVFYEAARVSISARTKGQGGGGCVIC